MNFSKEEVSVIYDALWRCISTFDSESKGIATIIINKIEKKDKNAK